MKKLLVLVISVALVCAAIACLGAFNAAENAGGLGGGLGDFTSSQSAGGGEFLRIHVRANSNSAEDQQVKYEVKDEVVAYLTPYVARCGTKGAAMDVLGGMLDEIAGVCSRALRERGYFYGARAEIRRENFPTRVYGDLTLAAGEYDALIVELGSGKGDNWWCVIYPPLCFTAGGDVQYRSLIYDIIRRFLQH